ncbi:conserved hypothetical protein (plasmid) [Rhodococcus jostii RHA1]|uniref:Alpha/beta hydrolase n=1 Tax=Rhodococcus jostii (strain RHA1) TaxID=101510 RepID=Q0RWM5_RHOJR|nr:hypothetical protein [Rhodococcus sp. DK17]ABH00311.1 conserved hypothetical protein [Rhodococcus jostii RHA1]
MTVTTIESSSHTIDVDGITTRYHKAGPDEPALLLHGSGPGVSASANLAAYDRAARRESSRSGTRPPGSSDSARRRVNMLRRLPNVDLHVICHCRRWTEIERAAEFVASVDQFLPTYSPRTA